MELPIWTPAQLGDQIHVRPSTLARWRSQGTGPRAIRLARHVFYLTQDVVDWLEMLPKAEGSPGNSVRFGANRRYPGSVARPGIPPTLPGPSTCTHPYDSRTTAGTCRMCNQTIQ